MNNDHPLSDEIYKFYLFGTLGIKKEVSEDIEKYWDYVHESFENLRSFTKSLDKNDSATWLILKGAFLILCEINASDEYLYQKLCEIELEEKRAANTGVLT